MWSVLSHLEGSACPLASSPSQHHLPVAYLHPAEIVALQELSWDPKWAQVVHQGHRQHSTSMPRSTRARAVLPKEVWAG